MSTQRTLLLFITLSLNVFSGQADLTYSSNLRDVPSAHYKFTLLSESALRRSKRDDVLFQHESSAGDSTEDGFTIVNETDTTNMTFIKIDHKYYELNLYKPEMGKFPEYWIDIPALLQNGSASVKGEIRHKQLAYSYRRAVSQKLTFKFPFYGHETENVTIATGGFVYAGDQVHSWLAATQYIAPLMANFDTTSSNDSNILYADTGDTFIVEWNQVVLRHQAEIGNFTFQVSLHKNGDIWFVYKNIPTEVKRVSDLHHPRKVGLSDAYLFTHTILNLTSFSEYENFVLSALSRRVIYEYHRVEVDLSFVKSGAVIVLKAQPVCIMLKTCRSCMSANLTSFNCTWCDTGVAADSASNSADTPSSFCSDREGLNRRRQHWLDFQCHKEVDHVYCNEDEHQTEDEDVDHHHGIEGGSEEEKESESTTTATTLLKTSTAPTTSRLAFSTTTLSAYKNESIGSVLNVSGKKSLIPAGSKQEETSNHTGVAILLIFLIVITSGISWLIYAYTNPQTPSGQFLIKYRPARWKWPGDHANVRYTASSVHM